MDHEVQHTLCYVTAKALRAWWHHASTAFLDVLFATEYANADKFSKPRLLSNGIDVLWLNERETTAFPNLLIC